MHQGKEQQCRATTMQGYQRNGWCLPLHPWIPRGLRARRHQGTLAKLQGLLRARERARLVLLWHQVHQEGLEPGHQRGHPSLARLHPGQEVQLARFRIRRVPRPDQLAVYLAPRVPEIAQTRVSFRHRDAQEAAQDRGNSRAARDDPAGRVHRSPRKGPRKGPRF